MITKFKGFSRVKNLLIQDPTPKYFPQEHQVISATVAATEMESTQNIKCIIMSQMFLQILVCL